MKQICSVSALALAIAAPSMSGCASNEPSSQNMAVPSIAEASAAKANWGGNVSLSSAIALTTQEGAGSESLNDLIGEGTRYQALNDVAVSFGTRVGLYERRNQLNAILMKTQPQLGRIYDFSQYLLPGNVFPPVMSQTQGMIQKKGRKELQSTRHSYHMLTEAVVLIEPPSYLNYLVRHYPEPSLPTGFRLPRTPVERDNWAFWVKEGWTIGRKQADLQFNADLARLKRDLTGVRLFHQLVATGVIAMPKMAKQDFGVVVSEDGRSLNIGETVVSIVKPAAFNASAEWDAITEQVQVGE
ncbi:type IV secretory system conjugative DNA transfer family protein [Marinobacterium stanieri]|uniref:Defect in organelle trafficking protein DotC n=1 Tax=Marinobacterium stanieri TaxID=49186 RepID=A0A1N6X8B2_9GAMM|nr:type IV secretory system conjugative DNA transfer family protein [Marinobacterium stanieri]SIQ98543.1 defect in organelle trafficking protein DotC [Marinobacterium stanieri]